MRYNEKLEFFAKDFYEMLEKQKYKCALSGRDLSPANTEVELRDPKKKSGRAEKSNHYMVDKAVSYLARHLTEAEIVKLAEEIINFRKPSSTKKKRKGNER